MKLTYEFESIREWAEERGIYENGDIKTQFIKLVEEVGELSVAILKQDPEEFKDAVGDCVVVLTNLVALANKSLLSSEYYEDVAGDGVSKMLMSDDGCVSIEDCINGAYEQIMNRKGKMENGTFKKLG